MGISLSLVHCSGGVVSATRPAAIKYRSPKLLYPLTNPFYPLPQSSGSSEYTGITDMIPILPSHISLSPRRGARV